MKIIDFGICKKNRRRSKKLDMMTITGTLFYRAPEMFSGGSYTEKVDVWALAILIYKRVTARTPFESEYLSDTIHNIQYSEPYFAP